VNAVAAGGAGVWVLGRIGAARISPASNHVMALVENAARAGASIAVGANSVWAAVEAAFEEPSHAGAGTLYKISGRGVVATTPLRKRPLGRTVGRDTVWIVLQAGDLVAVDSDTAAIVGNVDVGGRGTAVAVAGENV
jgi:hypothetical protein